MFVEGDFDIKFPGGGFPGGDLLGGFRADGVEFHLFGPGHDGLDFLGVFGTDDAVVHGTHAKADALGFQLGHGGIRHGVADFVGGSGFEDLAGVEFDHVAACFLGLGDGFEGGEFLEGVGLGSDEPSVLLEVFGDGGGHQADGEADSEGDGGKGEESGVFHRMEETEKGRFRGFLR